MLKLSLVVMFVFSLATLSFASSLMPVPGELSGDMTVAAAETPAADPCIIRCESADGLAISSAI